MNWLSTQANYENAMQNSVYKMINGYGDHEFKHYLTKNRSIRILAENKVSSHDPIMGQSHHTQKSYLYRAVSLYNKLPKYLTLIKTHSVFKKWCKRYNLNNNIKLRAQDYNVLEGERFLIDQMIIQNCENGNI